MESQAWAAGGREAGESAGTRGSGLGLHRRAWGGRGGRGGGGRGGGSGQGAGRPPRCGASALAPAGGAAAAHLLLPGHAGPRPPGAGVPLAAALHQLRPALAPDSPGLAQLRLHAARHRLVSARSPARSPPRAGRRPGKGRGAAAWSARGYVAPRRRGPKPASAGTPPQGPLSYRSPPPFAPRKPPLSIPQSVPSLGSFSQLAILSTAFSL